MSYKNYTEKGNPRIHQIRDVARFELSAFKAELCFDHRHGRWRHNRKSNAVVFEFLIWWTERTSEEGLTKISINDFSPETTRDFHVNSLGPKSFHMGEAIADKLADLKTCLERWNVEVCYGHGTPSTSRVIEFLIWYFRQIKAEKLTKISTYDFVPEQKKGRCQLMDNMFANRQKGKYSKQSDVRPGDIRKLVGPRVDNPAKPRKFR